jgi:hypothetical protein
MTLKAPTRGQKFYKASSFDEPQTLKISRAPEEIKKSDPKFGDANGMTTAYYFEDEDGEEGVFENHSNSMANAFNDAKLEIGDTIVISRSGEGVDSRYTIEKVV